MALDDSLKNIPDMMKAVYDIVAQVPEGRVTTYGEVAKALGDIAASRFVGRAMSLNQDIVKVPCRRVVQSDGSLGGYTGGGQAKKTLLLRKEGVRVSKGKIVDFDRLLFNEFITKQPLTDLRRRQLRLKKRLSIRSLRGRISWIAGIDVAYRGEHGYAAMVVFDHSSGREVERNVVEGDAMFPYIPTYLAFRELPVIGPLMRFVPEDAVLMYDGNGILHPEGFGIASQLGVTFDLPTIGVAKKLLCGDISKRTKNSAEIRMNGGVVGHAMTTGAGGKPIYVSPGHGLSPAQACSIVQRYMKYRVPEPTRIAHIVAEAARRGTIDK